jgi:hypothetical protein
MLGKEKLLEPKGPFQRLFLESSVAPVLDFLMIVASENSFYSLEEIAQYSAVEKRKTKAALLNLLRLGIVKEQDEMLPEDKSHSNERSLRSKGKNNRKNKHYYAINRQNEISMILDKLVLELTCVELRLQSNTSLPSIYSASSDEQQLGKEEKGERQLPNISKDEIGDTVTELAHKGFIEEIKDKKR